MIINTQTVKKTSGGNNNYSVLGGILDDNEMIYPSTKTPEGTVFVPSDNPEDYTKVDWIEATGTQYIETNTVLNSTDKIEAEASFANTTENLAVFCGRAFTPSQSNQMTIFNIGSNGIRADYNAITQFVSFNPTVDTFYKFVMDANKIYIDDVLKHTFSSASFTTINPAYLMASISTDLSAQNLLKGKYKYWKRWNNLGSMTASFYACYHTDTGILGMFDAVNNKFHVNAGTGNFTKPSDTSGEINLAEYLASLS